MVPCLWLGFEKIFTKEFFMQIGKVYGLSQKGIEAMMLWGRLEGQTLLFDIQTKITVIGEKQPCKCGSVFGHTDDCMSKYQQVMIPEISRERRIFLSSDDIRDLP